MTIIIITYIFCDIYILPQIIFNIVCNVKKKNEYRLPILI